MLAKELVAASSEPLILSLLSAGENYGYALIQEVKRLSGDKIETPPRPGVAFCRSQPTHDNYRRRRRGRGVPSRAVDTLPGPPNPWRCVQRHRNLARRKGRVNL